MLDSFDNSILKGQLVNGSGVAFQSCGFKPTDATPDDRFNSTIVTVESSEHFTAFSADDDLGEAVIAAVVSFLAVGTGFNYSPADQFLVDFFRNNGFVVTFYIVLRHKTIILNSGLVQKVCCVGFLEQSIAYIFLVSEYLVDSASVPPFSFCTGKDTVTLQSGGNLIHAEPF